MFLLCLESLIKQNYDGDFLVITNFKDEISKRYTFKNPIHFLNVEDTHILGAASNKFKIYEFDKAKNYDKILYVDVDLLFFTSPNVIFDLIDKKFIYVSYDDCTQDYPSKLMTEKLKGNYWWKNSLFEMEEIKYIERKRILGINTGIFAFDSSLIFHFEKIDKFFHSNIALSNHALEQPFMNLYLFRNNLFKPELTDYVTHNGLFKTHHEKPIIHFAGYAEGLAKKINCMNNLINLSNPKS